MNAQKSVPVLKKEIEEQNNYIHSLKNFILKQNQHYSQALLVIGAYEEAGKMASWTLCLQNKELIFSGHFMKMLNLEKTITDIQELYRCILSGFDFEKMNATLRKVIVQHQSGVFQHEIVQRPGRFFQTHLLTLSNEKGEPEFLCGILQDITDFKLTQKKAEKLSTVASQSDNAMLIVDKNYQLEWSNAGFTKLSGYKNDEIAGWTVHRLFQHLQIASELTEQINEAMTEKKSLQLSGCFYNRRKQEVWFSLNVTPYLDYTLEVAYYIVVLTDISSLKKAEQALYASNMQLVTQNEELYQQQEEILAQRDFIEVKNRELEERNRQIRHSINAAQAIQKAILPGEERMKDLFSEHFILYLPKDVVSGDFYWVDQVDGKTIAAVLDCTGHGVPGAFMTLIANNLLNQIIKTDQITDPATILNVLHNSVKQVLKQEETGNNSGMDIALIVMEKKSEDNVMIEFAGGKRPLYCYLKKEKKWIELQGTRRSIGGIQNERIHFECHRMSLTGESILFLFSDGLPDQNDKNRKRYSENRLKKILLAHLHLEMKALSEILLNDLQNFMTDTLQRDDILMIGMKTGSA